MLYLFLNQDLSLFLAEVNLFFIPLILEQKDLRRLASLDPLFNEDGFFVTAVLSLEQDFHDDMLLLLLYSYHQFYPDDWSSASLSSSLLPP